MKVVLDTNVLVSGLITAGGACGQIVGLIAEERIQPCVDERILLEYEAVLSRPRFQIDAEDAAGVLELIRCNGEVFTPAPLAQEMPDAKDQAFLEVAATAGAVLITGNTRHFPPRVLAGVTVMTPSAFLAGGIGERR